MVNLFKLFSVSLRDRRTSDKAFQPLLAHRRASAEVHRKPFLGEPVAARLVRRLAVDAYAL